jgi:hypothetical protein
MKLHKIEPITNRFSEKYESDVKNGIKVVILKTIYSKYKIGIQDVSSPSLSEMLYATNDFEHAIDKATEIAKKRGMIHE